MSQSSLEGGVTQGRRETRRGGSLRGGRSRAVKQQPSLISVRVGVWASWRFEQHSHLVCVRTRSRGGLILHKVTVSLSGVGAHDIVCEGQEKGGHWLHLVSTLVSIFLNNCRGKLSLPQPRPPLPSPFLPPTTLLLRGSGSLCWDARNLSPSSPTSPPTRWRCWWLRRLHLRFRGSEDPWPL